MDDKISKRYASNDAKSIEMRSNFKRSLYKGTETTPESEYSTDWHLKQQKITEMYKKIKTTKTTALTNTSEQGETIEKKIRRVVDNNEPITDGAPSIYTERKDGVIPAYNIRTDKWDIALTAMDQVNKNWETKNMEKPGTFAEDVPEKTDEGSPSEN